MVKLWKLWEPSNIVAVVLSLSIDAGETLHARFRTRSSSVVSGPFQNSEPGIVGIDHPRPFNARSIPLSGFGGINKYEGKK